MSQSDEDAEASVVETAATVSPAAPSPTPTPTASATPTPSASPTASATPSPSATATPSATPTQVAAAAQATPTRAAINPPSVIAPPAAPTEAPAAAPTETPTEAPTETATETATATTTAPPPPPPPPPGDSGAEGYAYGQLDRIRATADVGPLSANSALTAVARSWSQTMLESGSLIHNPNVAGQIPGGYVRWAENIAHANTIAEAMSLLENSSLHYQNMTYAGFTDVGIGVVKTADGQYWITQVFAQY